MGKVFRWLNIILASCLCICTGVSLYMGFFAQDFPTWAQAMGCNSILFVANKITDLAFLQGEGASLAPIVQISVSALAIVIIAISIIRLIKKKKSGFLLLLMFVDVTVSALLLVANSTQPMMIGYLVRCGYLLFLLIYTCATRDEKLKEKMKEHRGFFKNTLKGLDRKEKEQRT